ncbi:gamma-glutamyltransferase [Leptolyngbya iicbica]|uniref:Glutathione hydrolase proenzyme n=2 Tax=Cyanophyceae TaxID=3028117 RepID=A0A4Q7EFJ0_9CYAN|nr:gamma-glutamyltransferase [Leptolyngbya sp. LK]RZM82055.1 gamma-glutamyltransferase [Leptolyngbya sp. LK]
MNIANASQSVKSTTGLVVCPHHLASAAGAQILRAGGNAVDAAIATQAALGVVYPHMTGLGGDAFWLIYDAKTQALRGLNGSGRAAAQATQAFYTQQGYDEIPQRGPLAALTVPGAVDSWAQAHQQFSQLAWADLLQPAIALARNGYPATGSQIHWTRRDRPYLQADTIQPCPFLPNGEVPNTGETLTNLDLAATLTTLAKEGAKSFYRGAIAAQITDFLASVGGLLTATDLAQHRSDWVEPIETTYRGYRVAQLPPNSQGFTVLQMLNLIESFDLAAIGHSTADYYHLMVEATKLAFVDRDRWLTDPTFADIPIDELVSKAYSDRRRFRIRLDRANPDPASPVGGDTVYTAVVDAAGNAVSIIQSLYFDFGSAVVVPDTGFVLQNRGSFFSLDASHINVLAPRKRTFHTLMPGLVRHPDGSPYLVLGTMGGEGQPQTQLALLTRLLDYGFAPQAAIDQPRWLWGRTWGEVETGLTLEGRIPAEVQQALRDRGQPVKTAPDWTEKMGHAHVIRFNPDGTVEGGCDPRSDGAAIAP